MRKQAICSIAEKNRIASNIIDALVTRSSFLMVGHQNPDEDCFGSMVAFALLVAKFEKKAQVCVGGKINSNFEYLAQICRYNSITVGNECDISKASVDTVVVCDTAKPDMIQVPPAVREVLNSPEIVVVEFDHHLETDSDYAGQRDYALVTEASSAAELVGYVALKLRNREDILRRCNVPELFTRNFVLAVLTGIIGDTQMGKYVKTHREHRLYDRYSSLFNDLLKQQTTRTTNFSDKDQVYRELHRLSDAEARCHDFLTQRKELHGEVATVVLDEADSETMFSMFTQDTIVSVARAVADTIAEKAGRLSLVSYYDTASQSDFVQFRIRRSHRFKAFDVRTILDTFSIENGGGHEGAIGFRVQKSNISDIHQFTGKIVRELVRASNSA